MLAIFLVVANLKSQKKSENQTNKDGVPASCVIYCTFGVVTKLLTRLAQVQEHLAS